MEIDELYGEDHWDRCLQMLWRGRRRYQNGELVLEILGEVGLDCCLRLAANKNVI